MKSVNQNTLLSIATHLPSRNIGRIKQLSKRFRNEKELNKLAKKAKTRKRASNGIKRFTITVIEAKRKPQVLNREWMLHSKMPSLLRARRNVIPNGYKGRLACSGQNGTGNINVLPWGRNWKGKNVWEYNHWTKRDWALFRMSRAIKTGDKRKPTVIFKELMSKNAGKLAFNGGY